MIIDWTRGTYRQEIGYINSPGHVENSSFGLVAIWSYDSVTKILCVTVTIAGTYCYDISTIGGGGGGSCYLRRR